MFAAVNVVGSEQSVSCVDAIFATQEVIVRGGSRVYMCLYDLQKAFDLVEYPVLLQKRQDVETSEELV